MNSVKKNLIIDIAVFLVYLVAANPIFTGIGIHEWLGIGLFILFVVHCAIHFDWIVDSFKGIKDGVSFARQGNLIFDCLILAAFLVVTVSGIGISGAVLPALGLYADGYFFWNPLHSVAAKVLLALLVIHVVVHWKWVYNVVKTERGERHDEGNTESETERG